MPESLYARPKRKKKKKKKATLRPKTRNSLLSKPRRPQNSPLMNAGFVTDLYRPPTPRVVRATRSDLPSSFFRTGY